MKHLLTFIFSLLTITAFSQKHVRYIPYNEIDSTTKKLKYDTVQVLHTDSLILSCASRLILHGDYEFIIESKNCNLQSTYFASGDSSEIRMAGWENNKKRLLERATLIVELITLSDTTFQFSIRTTNGKETKGVGVMLQRDNVYSLIPPKEYVHKPSAKHPLKINGNLYPPAIFAPVDAKKHDVFILEKTKTSITLVSFKKL